MTVKEFMEQVTNEPLSSDAAPGYYMGLFLTILNEFREEKCSVLLGKMKAFAPEDLALYDEATDAYYIPANFPLPE